MGQTLENGVYLPSEGERNCYAGLKTNWEILDQKVADVTALQQAVAGALHREIVESLPTTDIDPNTIYMILSGTSATENMYNEFMYVNNAWELIGTSATDLTNYYTKAEVDGKLLLKANDSDVVHKSGNETVGGIKSFSNNTYITSLNFTNEVESQSSSSSAVFPIVTTVTYADQSPSQTARLNFRITANGGKSLYPHENNQYALGLQSRKWSEVRAVQYYYGSSDTEFSQKFVTTDTDQTISGVKTFAGVVPINGAYLGNEPSTSFRTVLLLRSRYDTAGKSGWLVSKFRSNSAQGALSGSDTVFLNFDVLENEVRTNGILRFNLSSWSGNVPGRFSLIPNSAIESYLGTSGSKWVAINGLEPSSLSLPSGNTSDRVDISSYITAFDGTTNSYTPPANGWISISANNCTEIYVFLNNLWGVNNTQPTAGAIRVMFPVLKGVVVAIRITGGSLVFARFLPCQGNV